LLKLIHDISLLLVTVVDGFIDSSAGAPPLFIVGIVCGCSARLPHCGALRWRKLDLRRGGKFWYSWFPPRGNQVSSSLICKPLPS
jgi:hypothetical protein